MRVVAGDAGGLALVAPEGDRTRPTGDRVRESVFNSLVSQGLIEGSTVLDLFAGTGAMGIEALSRGAEHAVFVERDRAALRAIAANLESTGLAERATVLAGEVRATLTGLNQDFDLAVIDPPYDYAEWADLLPSVTATTAVLESNRPIDPPEGWDVLRSKRFGTTVVTIVRGRIRGRAHRASSGCD